MIVVLSGGVSSEREVSLATAKTITKSLKNLGQKFNQIDLARTDWLNQVKTTSPKVCIIAAHGKFAEDGSLQEILKGHNIPFTGSSAQASRLCFDKSKSKKVAVLRCSVQTPQEFNFDQAVENLPVVVKPNQEGSSVGVSIVRLENELEKARQLATKYDNQILIEKFIDGRELTCGVIDVFGKIEALPLVEIKAKSSFFDYKSKYTVGAATEICPAMIDEKITRDLQEKSICLFKETGVSQYCRIDWILKGNRPYFIEINTLPGMTPTSLINKEIAAARIDFNQFIKQLITKV